MLTLTRSFWFCKLSFDHMIDHLFYWILQQIWSCNPVNPPTLECFAISWIDSQVSAVWNGKMYPKKKTMVVRNLGWIANLKSEKKNWANGNGDVSIVPVLSRKGHGFAFNLRFEIVVKEITINCSLDKPRDPDAPMIGSIIWFGEGTVYPIE